MPVDSFRFVSPGVFINEIDQSQIPTANVIAAGPVIFGVAQKGPALVPTRVSSFSEFVNVFGQPMPGTSPGGDGWRDGNTSNPTYGAYAAQAYLANGAPITFVRLVGDQESGGTAAGWDITRMGTSAVPAIGSSYGLFIVGSGSNGLNDESLELRYGEGILAAVFHLSGSATTIELAGSSQSSRANPDQQTAAATMIMPSVVGGNQEFRVRISGSQEIIETTFNFDPKSSRYIRKVFNTNPHLLNSQVTPSVNLKQHLLAESYERAVIDTVGTLSTGADISRTNFSGTLGVLVGLKSGSAGAWGGNFRQGYTTPGTPWIVGQDLTDNSGSFDVNQTVQRLFRVMSKEGTRYAQSNYKISIADIKQSSNPLHAVYGTFTLLVRDIKDTDEDPRIIEQYNNLNLNPGSNNFIGKRIGDRSFSYDSVNQKWKETGQYPVLSDLIRVEMDETVENGNHEAELLPFGFRGIPVYSGANFESGSATILNYALRRSAADPNAATNYPLIYGNGGISSSVSILASGGSGSVPADALSPRQLAGPGAGGTPGAIDFGGGVVLAAAASATITFTGGPGLAQKLTIVDTAGTSIDYETANSEDLTSDPPKFTRNGSVTAIAASLAACLADNDGHNGTITTSLDAGEITLTQAVVGAAGNTTIVDSGLGNTTIVQWANGVTARGPADNIFSASVVFPTLPLRSLASDGRLSKKTDAFFGLTTNQAAETLVFDGSIRDLVTIKATNVGTYNTILGPGFSLDDLVYNSGDANYSGSDIFIYNDVIAGTGDPVSSPNDGNLRRGTPEGARRKGTSMTAVSASYKEVLDQGFDRFTVPMYGGFDGFDIFEKNPFNNTRALGTTSKTTSASPMYYTLRKAIDSVNDVDQVNINMAAMPGVTDPQTTDYLIAMAEARKDTLAIIDLADGFIAPTEGTQSFSDRVGSSVNTVSSVKDRNFNSSYAGAYYPWVQIHDSALGARLWVPPSTIALGVLAASAARSELWFAPAGFNRGGLNNGNAGLNVVNVIDKLTATQRDNLYDVNVNPIASFPAEGIVIFGQKTLQATSSALDRINVRRLMIFLKKEIRLIANDILFDPNEQVTWNRFLNQVNPFLSSIKNRFGLSDYRVILDTSTTTPDMVDRNIMYAKILLKPTRAIEFIALDFVITRSGVDFG